jgi:hypothetical protein
MHLRITGDTDSEAGVGEIIDELSGPTRRHFAAKDYGIGLLGVVVVLMCQRPTLKLKRRVRLSRKDKKLYMDIMLNLNEMKSAIPETRRRIVLQRLAGEIPETVSRYDIPDFDQERFLNDLKLWLECANQ